MVCPSCAKDITPDSYFCTWCGVFVPAAAKGVKAGTFARAVALVLDPLIAWGLYLLGVAVVGGISGSDDAAVFAAVLLPVIYLGWFLSLLRRGLTPGKRLLGLQVVGQQTGAIPGFGTMFVREIIGRFVSGLVFGLGYLWALFDKNGQAWHDKMANTVVIKVNRSATGKTGAGAESR